MTDDERTDPDAARSMDRRLADIEHKLDHVIAICEALADGMVEHRAVIAGLPCRRGNGAACAACGE